MIGLDIGTKVIRACLFEGSFGRYTFARAFEEQIPTSTLNMGGLLEDEADETEEIDPKLMAEADLERRQSGAIHALLRQLPNSSVVTHQSATQVSIRTVSLPFTDSQNIAAALPSIVEELVPFDIDDLQIQHQILNKEDNASDVLVLITQEDIIQMGVDEPKEDSVATDEPITEVLTAKAAIETPEASSEVQNVPTPVTVQTAVPTLATFRSATVKDGWRPTLIGTLMEGPTPRAVLAMPNGDEKVIHAGDMLSEDGVVVMAIGTNYVELAIIRSAEGRAQIENLTLSTQF